MTMTGVLTVSLDLELGWGSFDRGGLQRHAAAYRRTPEVVDRLCDLFAAHDVSATWAVVGHLLEDCGGVHDASDPGRAAWLADAPCAREADPALWHAPELVDRVRDCEVQQDVGLHGYSHLVFDEHGREAAAEELRAARRVAEGAGLDPASFVFPRNGVAHVDLLAEHGLSVYRGRDARWYEHPPTPKGARRMLRFVDEAAGTCPPTVRPRVEGDVVCVPGSQVFRPDHGAWGWTPQGTQLRRARKGLDRAAARGEVFHLWFHPFNLGVDPDPLLATLDDVLSHADDLRRSGDLEVLSIRAVGAEAGEGRWSGGTIAESPSTGARRQP